MKNISIVCPINSLGYGISSYNIWKNIKKYANTILFPIGNVSIEQHWTQNDIVEDIKKQSFYSTDIPCLKIWHPTDLLMKPHGHGTYATYSFFELDKVLPSEFIGYNVSDIIITPTQWAKDVLVQNNISPNKIKVAPPGVDTSIFDSTLLIDRNDESTDDYVFLNIGKWEIRKGHDILVHIFNQAFDIKDNVRLVMVNTNPFISDKENKQWQDLYKNSKLGDKIYILPRLASQYDIAKVIAVSDCGIYPARSEGWNNEAIETMAMNKPVILTNYSGHTEYANKDNSYLININSYELAEDGKFFNGGGNWAKLDTNAIDQAIEHMRYVYHNKVKTNLSGLETAKKLNWDTTAQNILNIIYG